MFYLKADRKKSTPSLNAATDWIGLNKMIQPQTQGVANRKFLSFCAVEELACLCRAAGSMTASLPCQILFFGISWMEI